MQTISAIVDGNPILIISLLWDLIRERQISNGSGTKNMVFHCFKVSVLSLSQIFVIGGHPCMSFYKILVIGRLISYWNPPSIFRECG